MLEGRWRFVPSRSTGQYQCCSYANVYSRDNSSQYCFCKRISYGITHAASDSDGMVLAMKGRVIAKITEAKIIVNCSQLSRELHVCSSSRLCWSWRSQDEAFIAKWTHMVSTNFA
jgi:hypothetical protein